MTSRSQDQDRWSAWLGQRRHGGDPEQQQWILEQLRPIREQVIANARLGPGDRVLDVGCGDGLIAFAALEAVAPDGTVIFSDISADLLDQCRRLAVEVGIGPGRVRFVQAAAADLSALGEQTVDAVTMRSVLIYEANKRHAFAEFYRVLRPGGHLSLFEPINSFAYPAARSLPGLRHHLSQGAGRKSAGDLPRDPTGVGPHAGLRRTRPGEHG